MVPLFDFGAIHARLSLWARDLSIPLARTGPAFFFEKISRVLSTFGEL